jgi:hypothetical protein
VGKDGIELQMIIKKRPNFPMQRDNKIRDGIGTNGLGNRWRSAVFVCHRATGQFSQRDGGGH